MSSNWPASTRAEVTRRLNGGESPTDVARAIGIRRESVRQYSKVLAASSPDMGNVHVYTGERINPDYTQERIKPRIRVPYLRVVEPPPAQKEEDEAIRVCVIGDLHVSPGQDLSRLRWIARHIRETQPDYIVQIGDWHSFDSVSQHDPIGSIKATKRPSLKQDIDCLHESLHVFDSELGPSSIPRLITLGNHEHRVFRYEQLRSELEDSLWLQVLQSFAQFRWKTYDFGKVTFIAGVGFVHVPLNVIGKPHSSANIMLNELTHDLVKGHSHRATYSPKPKIGEGNGVFLIDVGTSLPHGHIESYAKLSQTGWWYGVHDVIIRNGRIDDFARISMKTLESRYA